MKNVIVNSISTRTSIGSASYMNIDADIDLTNMPKGFSYDSVVEALNGIFNPICFGDSLRIKKVIYNGPATIILWDDGIKTVVKCKEGDPYSHEAGFALAVLKRLTGNNFHRSLREAMKGAAKNERTN